MNQPIAAPRPAPRPLALLALIVAGAGCPQSVTSEDAGASRVVQIAAAGAHTCAIRADGRVRCWGLYDPSPPAGARFVRGAVTEVPGVDDAIEVAVDEDERACAVRRGGTVACWPLPGRRARPDLDYVATPVEALTRQAHLACGRGHCCALDVDAAVRCWGANDAGQLGAGDLAAHAAPVLVALPGPAAQVAAFGDDSCARLRDGAVLCWGHAGQGALGDGGVAHGCPVVGDCSPTPVRVVGVEAAEGLSLGARGGCVRQRGGVRCWGWNVNGRVGDGATEDRPTPVTLAGLDDAVEVYSGAFAGCVIRAGRGVKCWGTADLAAPGAFDAGPNLLPMTVPGVDAAVAVTGGWYHLCALRTDGAVTCWGANNFAQLARENPSPSAGPVRIAGL